MQELSMEKVVISKEIEQYEKKIYDQKQLIHISKALTATLNLNSLIESILNVSLAQSQTFQVGIYLNPSVASDDFILHENYLGFDIEDFTKYYISNDSKLIAYLATVNKVVSLEDLKKSEELNNKTIEKELTQLESLGTDLLMIPLKARGRINGIIVLGPKTSGEGYLFSEKDFLADLASIATIAVENARLYEMATVDMMTQVKIRHYFDTKLQEEIEIARKTGKSLSLYMADIDHFKKFNDTYGHQLGDDVLKSVARGLMQNSRSVDIVCRYGGEEFAVILPDTTLADAQKQAERARVSISKMQIKSPLDSAKENFLNVFISGGVVQFNPAKDLTKKIFIERCDKALYKAKESGRNRIIVAN